MLVFIATHQSAFTPLTLVAIKVYRYNHAVVIDIDDGGAITSNLNVCGRIGCIELKTGINLQVFNVTRGNRCTGCRLVRLSPCKVIGLLIIR